MTRKLLVIAAVAGVVLAVRRRRKRDEPDLWREATSAIDLR